MTLDTVAHGAFRIELEPAKPLGPRQELALLREAYRQRPDAPLLRRKLGVALLAQDAFDDVIDLLGAADDRDLTEYGIMVQAHFARETVADNHRAAELIEHVLPTLDDDEVRAQFVAQQAKAYRRLGRLDAARAMAAHALTLDPANLDACMRMASMTLDAGDPDAAIDTLDGIAAKGVSHAYVHAVRALAHARAGRIEAARAAVGFDDFHHAGLLDTPPGMTSLAAFNAALATELLDHPEQRYGRYGTAGEQTWRIDKPAGGGRAPMLNMLLDRIARAAEDHVARIAGNDHAWIRTRPDRAMMNCWCVITDGPGYETWHMHPSAWLSGVYYIQVPPGIVTGDDAAGCIAFGMPEQDVGTDAAAAYGIRLFRPEAGMMMLFPSHSHHRTFPHGTADRRICLAFDICPA